MADVGAHTRAFLTTMFHDWELSQESGPFVEALAEELSWTVTGSSPIAGTYHSKAEYLENVLGPLGSRLVAIPTLHLKRLLVDGEWAAAHLEGRGVGRRGENYDMDYVWLIKVQGDRIHQVIGFYDTVKVAALFETR